MYQNNSRTVAVVSYITWIGWIIAFLIRDRRDAFAAHHLNQALVIDLISIIAGVFAVIPLLGAMVAGVVNIAVIVFDIMGAVGAYKGSMISLPIVGDIHLIG